MSSPNQQASQAPANPRRQTGDELHALLYRDIGISAVAAALSIANEARATLEKVRAPHPLPAILRGHDRAA